MRLPRLVRASCCGLCGVEFVMFMLSRFAAGTSRSRVAPSLRRLPVCARSPCSLTAPLAASLRVPPRSALECRRAADRVWTNISCAVLCGELWGEEEARRPRSRAWRTHRRPCWRAHGDRQRLPDAKLGCGSANGSKDCSHCKSEGCGYLPPSAEVYAGHFSVGPEMAADQLVVQPL